MLQKPMERMKTPSVFSFFHFFKFFSKNVRLFSFFSDYISESHAITRGYTMKITRTVSLILLFLLTVTLTSCIKNPWQGRVIEEALIERISSNIIHIQTYKENGELQHYNINICDDVSWQGQKITLSDLRVGDRIRVTYDGAVIDIYPALIEGTTKIELLEDALSAPTKDLVARVEAVDGETVTLLGWDQVEEHKDKIFALLITADMRLMKDHRPADVSALIAGDLISVTYRGDIENTPEIIRIEIMEHIQQ